MVKYIVSDKEYEVKNEEELLMKIKDENPNSANYSLQQYMDSIAGNVINEMTKNKIEIPAKASDIVNVWKKFGMVSEATDKIPETPKSSKFQKAIEEKNSTKKER